MCLKTIEVKITAVFTKTCVFAEPNETSVLQNDFKPVN